MGQQCGPGAQEGVQTSGVHLGDYLIRRSTAGSKAAAESVTVLLSLRRCLGLLC